MKYFLSAVLGILVGIVVGYLTIFYTPLFSKEKQAHYLSPLITAKPEVIGFLPYWSVGKVSGDYSKHITTLTYFGLTAGVDGRIVKLANEQEEEPGWATLRSDSLQSLLTQAKKDNLTRSLLVFSGVSADIDALMSDPVTHANNLVTDVVPIMKEYGFSDLNLDIESIHTASPAARASFTQFVKTVRQGLTKEKIPTLSVEVTGTDTIKPYLIDISAIAPYVDQIILMAYDYHYIGSSVTGAVAPLFGAGKVSEFDTQAAIEKLLAVMPPEKVILGVPLYGYEWETLSPLLRTATIPGTGITASSSRVETFLSSCTTCTVAFDADAKESSLVYEDTQTGTYHQIFYPDEQAMSEKVSYAQTMNLGGMALWALGFEGNTILRPLEAYIK